MSLRSTSYLRTGVTALTKEPLMLQAARSAVVLVDYQQRLMPAIHEGDRAVDEAIFLARVARTLGIPVIGTEQNPDKLGPNDERIRSLCDRTMSKMYFGAGAEGLADLIWSFSRDIDQIALLAGAAVNPGTATKSSRAARAAWPSLSSIAKPSVSSMFRHGRTGRCSGRRL